MNFFNNAASIHHFDRTITLFTAGIKIPSIFGLFPIF
jgi:hypothetical protein